MKVLNFGSLNLDYVYKVEHFVRAGETLSSGSLEQFCGGKGLNQSIAFAKAGADIYHAGCIGSEGRVLIDTLNANGVDTRYIRTLNDVSCGHAIIQVTTKGENCILLFGGANQKVDADMVDKVLAEFGEGDLLMLQNEINCLDIIIEAAHRKHMTIALNPSPFDAKISALDLSLVDFLILNETEGCGITNEKNADDILNTLLARYPHMRIVLTLGGDGALYADSKTRVSHGIFPAEVVDTTAAGDTFTGFFFSAIMRGHEPMLALTLASAASSIAVSREGASPSIPTLAEVLQTGFEGLPTSL